MFKLNITHLEHTLIAVGIQAIILVVAWILQWLSVPVFILSAIAPSLLYFGREHAQAESRIKSSRNSKELTWDITLEAMMFWKWNYDSFMDLFLPVLACTLVSTICFIFSF